MSEPSLAAQRVMMRIFKETPAVTVLVPPNNIFDRNQRPELFPCIIVGDGQTVGRGWDCCGLHSDVYISADVYVRENGLSKSKEIAGAIRRAMQDFRGCEGDISLDFEFQDSVFLRDPDGLTSHAVVTFTADAGEDL